MCVDRYHSSCPREFGIQDLKALISPSDTSDLPPTDTNQAGPAVIALSEKWLTNVYTGSFTQHETRAAEGLSPSGTSSSALYQSEFIQQGLPNWTAYSYKNQTTNGQVIFNLEYGEVNGTRYSNNNGICSSAPDPYDGFYFYNNDAYTILTSELTGHVKLAEEGVMINGVLADRYELRMDNFVKPETVLEFISGDLYRAREGGYLLQLDYVVKIQSQTWTIAMGEDFSDTEPAQITYHFDRIYAPDESLTIEMPAVCADQVQ
jgi:hypothetical protein